MKKKFYLSHVILCIALICFGFAAGYFVISNLFHETTAFSFVALLYYIPMLFIVCVFPLYAGIGYLIDIIKGKDGKMYPSTNEISKQKEE